MQCEGPGPSITTSAPGRDPSSSGCIETLVVETQMGTGLWCGNNTALSVVKYSKIPPKIIHIYETWPTVSMTDSKIAVGQSVCNSFSHLAIHRAYTKSSLSAH